MMYNKIRYWYTAGLWNYTQVLQAVEKGVLTPQQAEEILKGEQYAEV